MVVILLCVVLLSGLGVDGELVVDHSLHVGLDDAFGVVEVGLQEGLEVWRERGKEVVLLVGVGVEVVVAHSFFAIEEEEVVLLHVLVYAVVVVEGPGLVGGSVDEVVAEGYVGARVGEPSEYGGHDVGLLCNGVDAAAGHGAGGVEEDDGHGVGAEGVVVGGLFGDVGVVGGDDEDGVAVPRHLAGGVEEAAQGVVGVADAGVDGVSGLVERVAIALWHHEGVVGGGGEERGDKGLGHLLHGGGIELQKFLVPDGPCAVEVVVTIETGVAVVFGTTIVGLETGGACKGLETHGAVFGTVEEGGGVAGAGQFASQTADIVERVAGDKEWFYKHGYT